MSQSTPTKHDGHAVLFAVAELLVVNKNDTSLQQLIFLLHLTTL